MLFCCLRYFLCFFLCAPVFAKEVTTEKKLDASVLLELCKNQLEKDPYLNFYIQDLPFENYSLFLVEERDLFFVEKYTPDGIKTNWIKKGHLWEPHIYKKLQEYAKPGTTVLDIGAHIGTHTLALSRFVGSNGQVISFEPQLKLFSELAINTYLNNCQNVSFFRRALGSSTGWAEMAPTNRLNEGFTLVGKGGDKVRMETLDSYDLENVSLIKMDVEGFEMEVIAGAVNTILNNKPVLLIEIWRHVEYESKIKAIEELGYTAQWLTGDDFLFIPTK